MPPAVPLVAALAGSAAAGIGAFGFATTVLGVLPWAASAALINGAVGLVVASGINLAGSRLLAPKPKTPDVTQAGGRAVDRAPDAERHRPVAALVGGVQQRGVGGEHGRRPGALNRTRRDQQPGVRHQRGGQ